MGGTGILESNLAETDTVASGCAALEVLPVVGEDEFDVARGDGLAKGMGVASGGTKGRDEGRGVSDGGCQSARTVGAGSES